MFATNLTILCNHFSKIAQILISNNWFKKYDWFYFVVVAIILRYIKKNPRTDLNFTDKVLETCFTVKVTTLPRSGLNVLLRDVLYPWKEKICDGWGKVLIE